MGETLTHPDRLISKEEVARAFGVSERGVDRLRAFYPDTFPGAREVLGQVRWLESEVMAFIRTLPKANFESPNKKARKR